MAAIGYTLSSEEQGPEALVDLAERAEQVGFSFEEAAELIGEDDIAESVVCGPDPERGSDQEGFFDFYERSVLPELR